jgi:hypothetical protein
MFFKIKWALKNTKKNGIRNHWDTYSATAPHARPKLIIHAHANNIFLYAVMVISGAIILLVGVGMKQVINRST